MEKQNLGEIISSNRRQKRMTQKELADMLNVTDKAVSKWERNIARPDINTIPKLAEILDVPVEDLIGIPISAKAKETPASAESKEENQITMSDEPETVEMTEAESLFYEKRSREHLILLIVQVIGAILGVIAVITDDNTFVEMLAGFLGMPLACAGFLRLIVRTFQIVRMKFGQKIYDGYGGYYIVPRNGLAAIASFVAVGILTTVITAFAQTGRTLVIAAPMMGIIEVFLLYTDIKFVCTAGRGRANVKVTIAFAAIMLVLSGIVAFMWFGAKDDVANNTEETEELMAPTEYQPLYATDFSQVASEFEYIRSKAYEYVLAEENRMREDNHEIVIPSSLKAAYFLSGVDLEYGYFDFGSGTSVTNAILVVGHYNVNIANTSPRDEWVLSVFPNFMIAADGTTFYDQDNVYREYLQAGSLEDVYTWMIKEYEGMTIVPLDFYR